MMKKLKGLAGRLALGIALGVSITRIVDGNNVIGAIVAGVVIGFIALIVHSVIFDEPDND